MGMVGRRGNKGRIGADGETGNDGPPGFDGLRGLIGPRVSIRDIREICPFYLLSLRISCRPNWFYTKLRQTSNY